MKNCVSLSLGFAVILYLEMILLSNDYLFFYLFHFVFWGVTGYEMAPALQGWEVVQSAAYSLL